MNRVEAAFERMEKQIAGRIASGITTKEAVAQTNSTLDMALDEYARFQELKSLAVAEGKLTYEEGQTIYAALGTTPANFNEQPVHVKAVLTKIFAELMESMLRRRGALV